MERAQKDISRNTSCLLLNPSVLNKQSNRFKLSSLGNVASCTGERLHWDRANLKVSSAAGEKFVQPERRKGWEL
jgi:hypothetical protein